ADRRPQHPLRDRARTGHRPILTLVAYFSTSCLIPTAMGLPAGFLDLPLQPRLRRSPMPGADRREGADLIVVGAGAGGLAAAITAADRGRQGGMVARAKAPGAGEAIIAAGSRWQQEAGVTDDSERLTADLLASGVASDYAQLVAALAAQSASLVEWLADRCGATIQLLPARVGGHPVARLHACSEHGGASLLAALGRVVGRHHRIRVRAATEVT